MLGDFSSCLDKHVEATASSTYIVDMIFDLNTFSHEGGGACRPGLLFLAPVAVARLTVACLSSRGYRRWIAGSGRSHSDENVSTPKILIVKLCLPNVETTIL